MEHPTKLAQLGAAMAVVALTAGDVQDSIGLLSSSLSGTPSMKKCRLTDTGNWRGKPWAVKAGRNEACPCGSGKKFKKCCYGKVAS